MVGCSNTDILVECPRLPTAGETVLGGRFARNAGGKGANQAVAAARAGAEVVYIGAHGADEFGAQAKSGLDREGIDVSIFYRLPNALSGVALIIVGGENREKIIAVARSANDQLSPELVEAAEPAFHGAEAVLTQLEVPLVTVETVARMAKLRYPFDSKSSSCQDATIDTAAISFRSDSE